MGETELKSLELSGVKGRAAINIWRKVAAISIYSLARNSQSVMGLNEC